MTSSASYGTLAWARRTSGLLGRAERTRQALLLARARVARQMRSRPAVPGFDSPEQAERALTGIRPSDTPAVRAVADLIVEHEPSALVQHSWRTYLFGRLLGLRDGISPDDEVLVLASLLHDLALGRRDHTRECFAHDGAEQALEILAAQGVDADRRAKVADAICLHLRVDVPLSFSPEAHLVHAGTALDVTGRRLDGVSGQAVRGVLERHPRLDLVDVLLDDFAEETRRHPRSRISHWMALGFGRLIEENPLARVGPADVGTV